MKILKLTHQSVIIDRDTFYGRRSNPAVDIWLNADHITKMTSDEYNKGTWIDLITGKKIYVTETPVQILAMLSEGTV